MKLSRTLLASIVLVATAVAAQNAEPGTKPETVAPPPTAQSTAPKPVISTTGRLNAARTVFLKKLPGGNDIPFNVISNGFDGWAKYMVVFAPEKADLVVEVTAPEDPDKGFAISSNSSSGEINDKHEKTANTSRSFNVTYIKMVVIDNHTRTPLWTATEQPRSAARKNKSQDNLVDAAQKLFQKFHDRVEPPTP